MKEKKEISEKKSKTGRKMTRKEALRTGGYLAFSAATMMLLLNNSANAQTDSYGNPADPGNF